MEKTTGAATFLKWSRRIRWAVILVIAAYLAICGYLWATQHSRIYEPSPAIQTTPDRLGMAYEHFTIPSGQGIARGELDSWWIPAAQADAPTLLYLHGNKNNISHLITHTQRLHEAGYNLLLPDYRGYGRSTGGPPDEIKMYEDAEAAWSYLIQQRKLDPRRVFIYGHSLGGAVAIELALHHPEAAGLIAEATFTSLSDMAERRYPWIPAALLLNQHFDSINKVGKLKLPVLFIHGTWDSTTPYEMSQQLYERTTSPKQIVLIERGEHVDTSSVGLLEYRATLNNFTRQYSSR